MPSLNTNVKAARIHNDDIEYLEGYMAKNGLTFSKFVQEAIERTKTPKTMDLSNVSKGIIADIEGYLQLLGVESEEFFNKLYEKILNDEIDVEEIMK